MQLASYPQFPPSIGSLENFIDAGVTILLWWAICFGVAFGTSAGGFIGTDTFFQRKDHAIKLARCVVQSNDLIAYVSEALSASSPHRFEN